MEAIKDLTGRIMNRLETKQKDRESGMLSEKSISPADEVFKNNRKSMNIDCKICSNTGILIFKEGNYQFSRECECMKVYKNKLRIEKSGLAKILDAYTFDSYKTLHEWQQNIMRKALSFLEQRDKWFYIGGTVGSGKTHICTAICGELMSKFQVYYMQWRDEIVTIKANTTNDEEYQRLVGRLKTAEVLYIDDLFKGKLTEADVNVAFEILNYRYINRLITIISSEKTVDDIIDIDEAVGSRIYQMSKGFETTSLESNRNYRLKEVGA